MYKNSKGSVTSTPSASTRSFGADITNARPQGPQISQTKSSCAGSVGMISATLKRSRELEEQRSAVNELAKRQVRESSPSERFKSFFGASANATPATSTPSRLRQLLSSTPTASSTPQRASIIPANTNLTPRAAFSKTDPSPSPSSLRPATTTTTSSSSSSSSSHSRPLVTPTRTSINTNKENAYKSCSAIAASDDRLAAANQQLSTATQASATLQKQVEALRAERRALKEQLAAKEGAVESLQKQLQDERVKTARLGVDNAKLQAELRKLGGAIIAAPSPFVMTSASATSLPAASPQLLHQSLHITPSTRLSHLQPITTAIPPPPPPPPPAPSFSISSFKQDPPSAHSLADAFTAKFASTAPKQSSTSLLSQALSEISSKVGSLRHVTPLAQADRRKSSDPSNWIEAALQQASARKRKLAPLLNCFVRVLLDSRAQRNHAHGLTTLQRRALIDTSDITDSNLSLSSDW
jgi:hypothetical protein